MMRKLATIRQVSEIISIEGADVICLAKVDGWQCVVKRGEFKAGDLGCYFEIDSWLSLSDPRFKFLEKEKKLWKGHEGVRLRTRKFRKALSQGLLLPLSDFPELKNSKLGDDVTEILKIEKWEPEEKTFPLQSSKGYSRKSFPHFIRKTDEERVQNLPWILEANKEYSFELSEKLDGCSCTVFYGGPDLDFGVCSRNIWLKKHLDSFLYKFYLWMKKKIWNPQLDLERLNAYWEVAKQYELDKILPRLNKQYALQGEIIGEGIQKNHYKLKGHEFYLFNVWDIEKQEYLDPIRRHWLVDEIWNKFKVEIKHVPVLAGSPLNLTEKFENIGDLVKFADGRSLINKDVPREGVVFKRMDGKFSAKAVSNKFLLKVEE